MNLRAEMMRCTAVALTLVLSAAAPVHAGGGLAVRADVGISMPVEQPPSVCPGDSSPYRPVLDVDVGYRVIDELAVGAHAGARTYPWEDCGGNIPGAYQMYRGTGTAIELGAGAQWSRSRFWASAWLGRQTISQPVDSSTFAYALAVGVDAFAHASGHRAGIYVDVTNADDRQQSDYYLSAGVAYRYW